MSVFGGDSWGREAQNRKRRIDEVVLEGIDVDGSSCKKLSSGKYACLVCPRNPIFDTPLMLSWKGGEAMLKAANFMHCKGSRHSAARSKAKEKELTRQAEINKRLALQGSPTTCSVNSSSAIKKNAQLATKPLIQMAQTAAAEIFGNKRLEHDFRSENRDMVLRQNNIKNVTPDIFQNHSYPDNETSDKLIQQHLNFREHRERELKFTSAGWKRDCHGKWYKDENVEFDSDEEDPNTSF
ncbi:sodium channel modifier 1-like isoform X2 [Hibiscus syriacus]|uniref:sodium channel modifier 1-like isoform X2 n=1 Tax=Hibiscus syriacus TaxID=106335 RepID=UPI001921E803|nr:sodium channel modifier 1-like isoform X2 [Hibiscus syriacus]